MLEQNWRSADESRPRVSDQRKQRSSCLMVIQHSKALCDFQKKNVLFPAGFTTKHTKNINLKNHHAFAA